MGACRLAIAALLSAAVAVDGAAADSCPCDTLALWSTAALHGANMFQGRNPGGGSSGFGDGDFSQSDFDDLRAAGANFIHISAAGIFTEERPYTVDAAALAQLDATVQRAERAGLYVGIAFRSGPGRNEEAITNRDGNVREDIWHDQGAQDGWAAMAAAAAQHFAGDPHVVGLSIMVEPNAYAQEGYPAPADFYRTFAGTTMDVNGLFARSTAAIRAVNTTVPILLEPEGFGSIDWLPYLRVNGDARTVYTPHDYTPFDYTHENVSGARYPGRYDLGDGSLVRVDRSYLQQLLGTLSSFSAVHGVPVALTEFGVHRTAPDASAYLADRLAIQRAIGSWAVWVWQPAGFDDPFSMHETGPLLDQLSTEWQRNCTPRFDCASGTATVTGNFFKVTRRGKRGSKLHSGIVTIDGAPFATTIRRQSYRYSAAAAAGTHTFMASSGRRQCVAGAPSGSNSVSLSLAVGTTARLDFFCR